LLVTTRDPLISQRGRYMMPRTKRLDMRGIDPTQRTVQSKLLAMLVQPLPKRIAGFHAVAGRKIDRTTVTISSGCGTPSVERIADLRFETNCKALPVVITKGTQDCPIDTSRVHCLSKMEKQFSKITVHPSDDIFLE